MENQALVETRLQNMQKAYNTIIRFIDELPSVIPEKIRTELKDSILGDEQLKALLEETQCQRPPRIFLFGRTGCGKSSLINALCGAYVAEVSDVESCTKETQIFPCMREDKILLEIMDSRGIFEADESMNRGIFLQKLVQDVIEFNPDVIIPVLSCVHRDGIDEDIDFAIELKKAYYTKYLVEVPFILVINKADAVPPLREMNPNLYSEKKLHSINRITQGIDLLQSKKCLNAQDILAVSSFIEWADSEGNTLTAEEINRMSSAERSSLDFAFDSRWNISQLLQVLEQSIADSSARAGLRMALRLEEIISDLAKHIVDIFAGVAGTVALTPIPVADLYVLLALQSAMVAIIAILSGREANIETAKEFILSLGGVGGAGLGFRLLAQQSSKLLNGLFPGAGSVISTTVAASGTKAIGAAAISYYLK